MSFKLLPASFVFFFVIIIISSLDHLPTSFCIDDAQYVACAGQFQCANILNLEYPFWGNDRPEQCGHPGFQLNCQGDFPLITIQSRPYRVLGIDIGTLVIRVGREDLLNDTCPTYLYDTSLDYTLFKHPPKDQNLTMYYGCPRIRGQVTPYEFDCTVNGTDSVSYFATRQVNLLPSVNLSLCSQNIQVPVNETVAQTLSVPTVSREDLQAVLAGGFGLEWEANDTNCNSCARSGGRCGYNSTSASFICLCIDRPYPLICNETGDGNSSTSNPTTLSIVLPVIGAILAGICIGWLIFFRRQRRKRRYAQSSPVNAISFWKARESSSHNIETFIRNYGPLTPKQYIYTDIKKMTNSFNDKLGQGGYGGVYKGKLSDGRLVAVKVLNETKSNGEEFINEVASISRTSHVNVVTLLGFCFERNRRALIYEFMPNKSLDKFIYADRSSNAIQSLDWKTLYQIAVGIARGLEYLHRGCNTRIVHFDIKPQNILLDEDFCPKISDFGLAKLCKKKESVISMLGARGTAGFIAPEVFSRNFGRVSHKSDVYSYGMMVLEMTGASKNSKLAGVAHSSEVYFPDWIYEHLGGNNAELGIHGVTNDEEEGEAVRKMMLVSLWCIQTIPADRPSMSKVVEMLEGNLQSLQIPPKPLLHSPTRSAQDSYISLPLSSENIIVATNSISG